jgi:hypothetical protein
MPASWWLLLDGSHRDTQERFFRMQSPFPQRYSDVRKCAAKDKLNPVSLCWFTALPDKF